LADNEIHIQEKIDFLFNIIRRYDSYIGTTNVKAGLMLSFMGTIIVFLATRSISIDPALKRLDFIYYAAVFSSIITILLSISASITLLMVIFPNTKNKNITNEKSLIFFGDVSTYNTTSYYVKIKKSEMESLLQDLSAQTYILADIVNEKFRILKKAVWITYTVVPLFVISLILLTIAG
jgi:predicted ferric reductase